MPDVVCQFDEVGLAAGAARFGRFESMTVVLLMDDGPGVHDLAVQANVPFGDVGRMGHTGLFESQACKLL